MLQLDEKSIRNLGLADFDGPMEWHHNELSIHNKRSKELACLSLSKRDAQVNSGGAM